MVWLSPILWVVLVSAVGVGVFPLAYYFFPGLSDRGYAVSKVLGLLLWGYIFWLLSSINMLVNTPGGIWAALFVVLVASFLAWRKIDKDEFKAWLTDKRKSLISIEILFLVSFVFLLIFRGMSPAIFGTEQPMELAFINGILRSPKMPPLDPWLAGYSISYYYFGYVIVAMLAKITGVSAGVAFNLGLSLIFAMGAVGAYGILHNLLAALPEDRRPNLTRLPVLGPLFVLILGNVEGFMEFIHGRGAFWQQTADGSWSSKFWTWVNIEDLKLPPPNNTAPGQLRHWWWWRASRVLADYDLFGIRREVIDEFPFFSFYLGDLHPHVLVIPFVMLALTFSLNIFLQSEKDIKQRFTLFKFDYDFSPQTFILGLVIFGGLGFLNIWDFPWYVVVFAGVHMLRKVAQHGWSIDRLVEFVVIVLAFGVFGIVTYLPFYISFSSQAGGLLPNVISPTRGIHMWTMFGTLFLPLFSFLIYLAARRKNKGPVLSGLGLALFGVVVMFGLSLLMTILMGARTQEVEGTLVRPLLDLYNAESTGELISLGLTRRGTAIFSTLTLTALLGLAFGVLWPDRDEEGEAADEKLPAPHIFAVVMLIVAGLLVVVPEFFYLRDLFGSRMNTIFKFYYQGWILWALAGAYGSAVVFSAPKKQLAGKIYPVVFVITMVVGLTYPAMGLNTRITSFLAQPEPALEVDGTANNLYLSDDEHAAVAWLLDAPTGALVEAIGPYGGSYSLSARISMNSGQPALLGWGGHEAQWRGGNEEMGTRKEDIEQLYQTPSWQDAARIIEQYQIVYIVVGNMERTTYAVYEEKFINNLATVFQQGGITIYQTGLPAD
jgi:YYY domain-containing protein